MLAENHAMLTVFSDAGFTSQRNFDLGTVVLTLGTGATDESTARADAREFQAEARSLAPCCARPRWPWSAPRSDGTGIGATVLRSIVDAGFTGRVVADPPPRPRPRRAWPPTRRSSTCRTRSTWS